MRLASRSVMYGLALFAAIYGAIMLGVTLETWLSLALTGEDDVRPNFVTVLLGSMVLGLVTAYILEDLR